MWEKIGADEKKEKSSTGHLTVLERTKNRKGRWVLCEFQEGCIISILSRGSNGWGVFAVPSNCHGDATEFKRVTFFNLDAKGWRSSKTLERIAKRESTFARPGKFCGTQNFPETEFWVKRVCSRPKIFFFHKKKKKKVGKSYSQSSPPPTSFFFSSFSFLLQICTLIGRFEQFQAVRYCFHSIKEIEENE